MFIPCKKKHFIILCAFICISFIILPYSYKFITTFSNTYNNKSTTTYTSDKLSLEISDIITEHYKGKIVFIELNKKNTLQVALSPQGLGTLATTSAIAKNENAILAINGGGAYSEGAKRPLNFPYYVTIHEGKYVSYIWPNRNEQVLGFTPEGQLVIERWKHPNELLEKNVVEAISHGPVLINKGKPIKQITANKAARSAIGQTKDGTIILVVIDNLPFWSEGATLETMQSIFLKHKAYNAFNLEGNNSATLYFKGQVINKPSSLAGEEPVASAIIFKE